MIIQLDSYKVEEKGDGFFVYFDDRTKRIVASLFGGLLTLILWIGFLLNNASLALAVLGTLGALLLAIMFLLLNFEVEVSKKGLCHSFKIGSVTLWSSILEKKQIGALTFQEKDAFDGGEGLMDKMYVVTVKTKSGKKWKTFKLTNAPAAKELQTRLKDKLGL